MGCDKAGVLVGGEPLWRRQIATLRGTQPSELFISGKSGGPYANKGIFVIPDETPGCGPLGGIASALRHCKCDRLLVLAVDMPAMTPGFLCAMLDQSRCTGLGSVPSVTGVGRATAGDSTAPGDILGPRLEPLVAVYPGAALAIATECLRCGERRMETFVRKLEAANLVQVSMVAPAEVALFENWNMPDDIPPSARADGR